MRPITRLVVATVALTTLTWLVAIYAESRLAAQATWALLFATIALVVLALVDLLRRALSRVTARS